MSRKQKEDIPPAANVSEDEENSDQDFEDEEGGFHVDDIYIPPPVKPYCSAESKGPRLLITKLTNINFKSYANTIEVGPFHHVRFVSHCSLVRLVSNFIIILEILCCYWSKW